MDKHDQRDFCHRMRAEYAQGGEAGRIRAQYLPREHTPLDTLRELDKKAKRPAKLFAYLFGTLAALVMGAGMSLIMTDIGLSLALSEPFACGLVIGVAGLLMGLVNYPVYKAIMLTRSKKYAERIIALSDELLGEE